MKQSQPEPTSLPTKSLIADILSKIKNHIDPSLPTYNTHPFPKPYKTSIPIKIEAGDNLSSIFQRNQLSIATLYQLLENNVHSSELKKIHPGEDLIAYLSTDNILIGLDYNKSDTKTIRFLRIGEDGFSHELINKIPKTKRIFKHVTIQESLFKTNQKLGIEDKITLQIADIFKWDIDFVLDIRNGDEFYVLYEEQYLGSKKIETGPILATEFINKGNTFRAVRYVDSKKDAMYYTPNGKRMQKTFLRAPLHFSRISSHFNMKRKHPLFKTNRPHKGIDYAAPTGTPIFASGDGKIAIISKTRANGNYIVIRHNAQYQTKYLHLSKFAKGLKRGSHVKQNQVIGYVGSTGYATGPHLHYEFLVNGVHKNPRTVKLPEARSIQDSEKHLFIEQTEPLLALLKQRKMTQLSLKGRSSENPNLLYSPSTEQHEEHGH